MAVRKFALENSDYATENEQASTIRRYVPQRNKHQKACQN
jgi:hypothetical protein